MLKNKNKQFKPSKAQTFGMYLEKEWYSLNLKEPPEENLISYY